MTLTNDWWLLIWIFAAGILLAKFFPQRTELVMGKREQRWNVLPAVILVIPYIVWAGFRSYDVPGFDTSVYRSTFLDAPSQLSQLPEYLETVTKDKGFAVLTVLLKGMIGNSSVCFFLILAAFQMLCMVLVYRKYSCDYWFSMFVFIASSDYISWMHNGIRQFTAVTLIFAASVLLFKKNYIPFIAVILVASTIHASALLMLPIIFIVHGQALNKRTLLCVVAVIIALLFVDEFTSLLDILLTNTQYQGVVSEWQSLNDDGASPLRAMVDSVPAILAVVGRKWIQRENHPVINIAANASVITASLSWLSTATSGIFLGRLPIWVSLYAAGILLPWEINNIFTKESAKLMKELTVLCYVVYFYCQMHFSWGLL